MASITYSEAIALAKAAQKQGLTEVVLPIAKRADSEGGGQSTPGNGLPGARTFSEVIAETTLGVDGEGKVDGPPRGQGKPKKKINRFARAAAKKKPRATAKPARVAKKPAPKKSKAKKLRR